MPPLIRRLSDFDFFQLETFRVVLSRAEGSGPVALDHRIRTASHWP